MISPLARPRLGAVFCLASLALASPALAADVTLENVTRTQGDTTTTFPRIEVSDTNLTKDEVEALFSGKLDANAAAALVDKAKAAKLSIPEVRIALKGGTVSLHDFTATDIDSGKAGHAALASADGALVNDEGQPLNFHSNALTVDGLSVGGLLDAVKTHEGTSLVVRTRNIAWTGLDATIGDKDTPKDAVGGNLWHLRLGGFTAMTNWDGDLPRDGNAAMNNLVIEPPRASEAGRMLASSGWERLDFSMTAAGAYDAAARTYSVDDYTLSEAKSGALKLTTKVTALDKAVFTGPKNARYDALMNGEVSQVTLRFDNAGLFQKAVEFFATTSRLSPDAVKKQWSAAATQFIPFMLAGDPAGLKIASAVVAFIAQPKSLQISARAKGDPLKFRDLAAMQDDPSQILERVELDATANP